MTDITWTNATVKLSQLQPWQDNPKTSTAKNAEQLTTSVDELGQFQDVAIGPFNGNGLAPVYDGHQRLNAWAHAYGLGYEVTAKQSSRPLTEDERRKVAIYSRQIGAWNWEKLANWDVPLVDWGMDYDLLGDMGRDYSNLAEMLASDEEEEGEKNSTETRVNEIYTQKQIIEAAFVWFRANGFPYRDLAIHVSMQEINKLLNTDFEKLINTNTGYHVADTYHPHRFHAAADGMRSASYAFHDDDLLRRALKNQIEQSGGIPVGIFGHLQIVSGTQNAANFRPGFAAYLYRKYCPQNATVLDTSTGYGGRLIGFIGSGVDGFYIGIDPNTETHNGNVRMADELRFSNMVELHNLPAEDVPHETVADRCDFAFTSPPYFCKEHYSDEDTQSWKRYQTGDEWRDGFLFPMMALQYAALKNDCYSIVNIADVKIKNKLYSLVEWTKDAAIAAGFAFVRCDEFPLSRRFGAGQDDEIAIEPVLIFRKLT